MRETLVRVGQVAARSTSLTTRDVAGPSAIAGVDRPQRRTARALEVDPRRVIAQQVLPMRTAIAATAALPALVSAPVAGRARQPSTPRSIGMRVNRQRKCHGASLSILNKGLG